MVENHRLLVIDRFALLRDVIARHLCLDQHEVVTATDESEGLELLRSGLVPCVILLDFLMAEANSGPFIAELKRDPRWALMPVVAMTGVFDTPGTELATARIRKPFRITELRVLVERICSQSVASSGPTRGTD